jgi:AraC-like DNA-binding protein
MRVQYDTDLVPGPDRYEYYLDAAASEVAPVAVNGRAPGWLRATLSGVQAGEFLIEAVTFAADSQLKIVRNERMIRAGDPGCYRMCLHITGGDRAEQAGNQVLFAQRDIGVFSLSAPYHTSRPARRQAMRVVMVTFPRSILPLGESAMSSLAGTVLPPGLPGRSLFAQFLIDLAGNPGPGPDTRGLAEVLREVTTGLIRERLGMAGGFTPATRCRLYQEWVRAVIGWRSDDPELRPAGIARAVDISERYLHRIFRDADQSPMRLVKAIRLEQCHRDLSDPALAAKSIREIAVARGYRRADQFAHDFRQRFGIPATRVQRPLPQALQDPRRPA